jgi:hypothetical protein
MLLLIIIVVVVVVIAIAIIMICDCFLLSNGYDLGVHFNENVIKVKSIPSTFEMSANSLFTQVNETFASIDCVRLIVFQLRILISSET